jgi:hypothetical protein
MSKFCLIFAFIAAIASLLPKVEAGSCDTTGVPSSVLTFDLTNKLFQTPCNGTSAKVASGSLAITVAAKLTSTKLCIKSYSDLSNGIVTAGATSYSFANFGNNRMSLKVGLPSSNSVTFVQKVKGQIKTQVY